MNLSCRGLIVVIGLVVVSGLASCGQSTTPAALQPTLGFRSVDGGRVAMQSGQPVPSFGYQPVPRLRLDLDTGWRWQPMPLNEALSFEPRRRALSLLQTEAAGRIQNTFDDSAWKPIDVPGSVDPPPAKGPTDGFYRLTFAVPETWIGKTVRLKFGSVNYLADVWLNGAYLGNHEGGTTPFAFDPGKALRIGEPNVLAVRVIDPPLGTRLDVLPWGLSDWWDYAGITGAVWLEASNPLHVVRADVIPHLDSADVSVVLQNSGDVQVDEVNVQLQVLPVAVSDSNLLNPNPVSLVPPEADPIATLSIDGLSIGSGTVLKRGGTFVFSSPDLWSLQRPALYVLAVYISMKGDELDSFYDTFGLRRIQVDPNKPVLLLNGEPTAFTGVAVHDERVWPGVKGAPKGGTPLAAADVLRQLRQARDVNADLLRPNHMPANPMLLMLADRLGLGVWEEIPFYHATPESFSLVMQRGLAQQMLSEMDLRDFNRPSVLFHGFANESTGVSERQDAMKKLRDLDRSIDGTRLTGQAMYGSDPTDPTSSPLDVAGYTFYYGVFYGGRTAEPGTLQALEAAHRTYPRKPVMILEFGDWANGKLGEQDQLRLFRDTYPALFSRLGIFTDGYVGSAVWWSLNDYWTEVPGLKIEHFGLYRVDGSLRPVGLAAQAGFGQVTSPPPSAKGIPSGGKGVAAPVPEPSLVVQKLLYALAVPLLFLIVLIGGLLGVRHFRGARRRPLEVRA